MSALTADKQEAAAEVMAFAADILAADIGSFEVAEIIAMAFGDACGMLGVRGVEQEVIDRLNQIATKSAFDIAQQICLQAGAGRA